MSESGYLTRNSSLMRAHAALGRLDKLKSDALLHPIDLSAPIPTRRSASRESPATGRFSGGGTTPTLDIVEQRPTAATTNVAPAAPSAAVNMFTDGSLLNGVATAPPVDNSIVDSVVEEPTLKEWPTPIPAAMKEQPRTPTTPTAAVPEYVQVKPSPLRNVQAAIAMIDEETQAGRQSARHSPVDEATQTKTPTTPLEPQRQQEQPTLLQSYVSGGNVVNEPANNTFNAKVGKPGKFSELLQDSAAAFANNNTVPPPPAQTSHQPTTNRRQQRHDEYEEERHQSPKAEEAAARALLKKKDSGVLNRMLSEIATLRTQQERTIAEVDSLRAMTLQEEMARKRTAPKPSAPSTQHKAGVRKSQPQQRVLPTATTGHSPAIHQQNIANAAQPREMRSTVASDRRAAAIREQRSTSSGAPVQRSGMGIAPKPSVGTGARKASPSSARMSPSVAVGRRHREESPQVSHILPGMESAEASMSPQRQPHGQHAMDSATAKRIDPMEKLLNITRGEPSIKPSSRTTRTAADARRIAKEKAAASPSPPARRSESAANRQSSKSPKRSVKEFNYSRQKLVEHNKRRKSYLQTIAERQEHTMEGQFVSKHRDNRRRSPANASQRRNRSTTPSKNVTHPIDDGQASPYKYWQPMPNRHVTGGAATSSAWMRTPRAQTMAKKPSNSSDNHPREEQIETSASPNRPLVDVSPLSDDPSSPIRRGGAARSTQPVSSPPKPTLPTAPSVTEPLMSSPAPSPPRWTNLPLLQFLLKMRGSDIDDVQREIRSRLDGCNEGDVFSCRFWLTLTQLANQRTVLEHVIAPLLSAELQFVDDSEDHTAPESRLTQLLCVLCGMGVAAKCAMDPLVHLLERSVGDTKLVALAIRAVGGADAIRLFTNLTQSDDPRIAAAAMYGLSLLPEPLRGHTTICCIGCPALRNKISYYQPALTSNSADRIEVLGTKNKKVMQHQPDYRETHVLLDCDLMGARILEFLASPQYRPTLAYPNSAAVMEDFFKIVPFVLTQLPDVGVDANKHIAAMKKELYNSGLGSDALNGSAGSSIVLDGAYHVDLVNEHTRQAVVVALMHFLHAPDVAMPLKEQALLTLASLPNFFSHPALPSLLQFVTTRGISMGDTNPDFLALSCVSLGQLASNNHREVAAVGDTAAFLAEAIGHAAPKVRMAATMALGQIGEAAAPEAATALHRALLGGEVNTDTGSWALSRMGNGGIAALLEILATEPAGEMAEYVARSLVNVTTLGQNTEASPSKLNMQQIDVVCTRLVAAANAFGQDHRNEEAAKVAVACVDTIGGIGEVLLRNAPKPNSTNEAVTYYKSERPNPLVQMLNVIIMSKPMAAVGVAAAVHLAKLGGAHGEVRLVHMLLEEEDVSTRRAAAKAMKFLGPKIIRALALSLNDSDVEVRTSAVDTIGAIGVDTITELLRNDRPLEHASDVHRCCAEFLQRHDEKAAPIVQALFGALQHVVVQ